jgi:hypothetical protein
MAIQIQIADASIADNKIHLVLTTTNDAQPGETQRFSSVFDATASVADIKNGIDAQATLLWQALSAREWEID